MTQFLDSRVGSLEFQVRRLQLRCDALEVLANELLTRIELLSQPRDVRYVPERVRKY